MILVDTGFWLALANRRDHYHETAKAALKKLQEPMITTWPVLTETCHLLLNRMGTEAQQRFLSSWEAGAFQVHPNPEKQIPCISTLMAKYSDLPMDLADASLVLLAEHFGHGRILSTDQRDFQTYRWKNRPPFENLLLL
ncbi:MAG: PIN domain-containing protein [SAR324 cluster bacterium]|nr:PIN domain-containing protein [SAR324 cluster bacterium]